MSERKLIKSLKSSRKAKSVYEVWEVDGRIMVTTPDGLSDWPICYEYNFRVAYDHPEWFPQYVKSWVGYYMQKRLAAKLLHNKIEETQPQTVKALQEMIRLDDLIDKAEIESVYYYGSLQGRRVVINDVSPALVIPYDDSFYCIHKEG